MSRSDSYPGSIDRLPSGSLRWRVSINGHRFSETKEDYTLEEMCRYARQNYDQLADQVERTGSADVRLPRFLTRFENAGYAPKKRDELASSTKKAYGIEVRAARTYFGDVLEEAPRLRNVDRGHIKRFLEWRKLHGPDGTERKDPISGKSLRRSYAVLHRALEYAFELELLDGNPARRVEAPSFTDREPVLLSDDQMTELEKAARAEGPMCYTYIVLLKETGLRPRSEALWLKWEDLDLGDGFLTVVSSREDHETKTKKSRPVPLTPTVRERLREHAARFRMQLYGDRRSDWVFHTQVRKRNRPAGSRRKTFDDAIRRVKDAAGIPSRWRPHDLRHQRVTSWLAAGKSPAKVQKAVGHSDRAQTEKYTHLIRDDLTSLVEPEPGTDSDAETGS